MRARGSNAPQRRLGHDASRVLVSRRLAPMAALPVAGLAAVVCAFVVLARDEGRERRGPLTPPSPAPAPSSAPATPDVTLAPPPRVERRAARAASSPPRPRARQGGPAAAGAQERRDDEDLQRALTVMLDPLRPWSARLDAALTLGRAGATEALLSATASADEAVRGLAVAGLDLLRPGARHDEPVLAALTRLVDDPAPDVSSRAAHALARTADGRRGLVARLRGAEPAGLVHLACVEALREHGTLDDLPGLLGWATTDGPVGEAAAAAVRAISARAGVESPLPPPEPPGEPRPSRD